jgi:DDE superfamily endonuclease
MFCGSATGEFLPPYVVYKGLNCYEGWTVGGPKGAAYTSTKSGWFDMFVFTDWFKKIFLPHVRRQEGPKLLVGDNLASHISLEVITLCRENNIRFVCLPPNSTDKMQPLDVGVFAPLKQGWKQQLRHYLEQDPAAKLLQKTVFPRYGSVGTELV